MEGTGAESGVDVLDIDKQHNGGDWYMENKATLPVTRVHRTRSGGLHCFFQHHDGLRNSTSKIAPGVDVKAENGCVVWWPVAGFPVLSDAAPAPWPEWLLSLARPTKKTCFEHKPYEVHGTGYAVAALRNAVDAVAMAKEGQRNDTLNRECFNILRFAESGTLAIQEISNAFASAALRAGLSAPEVTTTLVSAIRARGIA